MTFLNVTFLNNTGVASLNHVSGYNWFISCIFDGNRALNHPSAFGGVLDIYSSTDSYFYRNSCIFTSN